MFERAELGFNRHFHTISFCSLKPKSLKKQLFLPYNVHMGGRGGGGKKKAKKVSCIIWMAPKVVWNLVKLSSESLLLIKPIIIFRIVLRSLQSVIPGRVVLDWNNYHNYGTVSSLLLFYLPSSDSKIVMLVLITQLLLLKIWEKVGKQC